MMTQVTQILNVNPIQLLFKSPQDKYDHNFAISNICVKGGTPVWKSLHFIFTLDRSGSMSQRGRDGNTAWDNVTHMMHNIFTLL